MRALQRHVGTWAVLAASAMLLVAAVAVRGMGGAASRGPIEAPAATMVAEPMQLLGTGSKYRLGMEWAHIPADQRARWRQLYPRLFDLKGCPRLGTWLQSPDGLAVESFIHALQRGPAEQRLTALALIFQIGRATAWEPTLRHGNTDAVRLGALLESNLTAWASAPAEGYEEPIVAALLVYGRAMRAAWDAPMIGHDDAALARARGFLERYLGLQSNGLQQGAQGPGSQLLRHRHPLAWQALSTPDPLHGLDAEARRLYRELDGECGA